MTEPPRALRDEWTAAASATDPLDTLATLSRLRGELTRWEAMAARQALAEGASWATIGEALGTSRQAAWERLRPVIKELIETDRRRVESARRAVRSRRTDRPDPTRSEGDADV